MRYNSESFKPILSVEDIPKELGGDLGDFCYAVIRGEAGLIEDLVGDRRWQGFDDWIEDQSENLEELAEEYDIEVDYSGCEDEDEDEEEENKRRALRYAVESSREVQERWARGVLEDSKTSHAGSGIFEPESLKAYSGWIVHYTNEDPERVLKQGWEGVSVDTCGITKLDRGEYIGGDLGFGYPVDEDADTKGSRYGNNYILTKSPAVLVYHTSDDEEQVVFSVSDYMVAIPVGDGGISLSFLKRMVAKSDRKALEECFVAALAERDYDEDDLYYGPAGAEDAVEFLENVFQHLPGYLDKEE